MHLRLFNALKFANLLTRAQLFSLHADI